MHKNHSAWGTFFGLLAVLIWSMAAPIITYIGEINQSLYLSLLHGAGFVSFCVIWCLKRQNPLPKLKIIPLWFYICAFFGIVGHSIMWILAIQNAPPLQATLIIYIWPMLVIVFTSVALKHKLYWYHYFACVVGFAGVFFLLLGNGLDLTQFNIELGHIYALLCALFWSVYAAISARQKHLSINVLSIVYFISLIVNVFIWLFMFGAPSADPNSIAASILLGCISVSGYVLWDYGMKNGNVQLIGIASFMTPVLATFYIVAMGEGAYTRDFVVALTLVMTSIFIVKFGSKFFKKKIEF